MPLTKGRKIEVTPLQRGIIRDGIEGIEIALRSTNRWWKKDLQEEVQDLKNQVGEN